MVLQRIQSLYLLLAAILMSIFTFMPVISLVNDGGEFLVGAVTTNGVNQQSYLLLILDLLIVALSLVTIFKFKNLKKQISFCSILLLLVITLLVCIGVMMVMQKGIAIAIVQWPIAFPFVAMVLVTLARSGMKHDKKVLSDSERIR